MRPQPVAFDWKELDVCVEGGEVVRTWAMVPLRKYHNVCRRQFGDGGEHVLEPVSERSMASHNQYFAAMHDHYLNLPETVSARWPTETHFRRWLLIECGFFDEKEFDMDDSPNARRLGTFIRTEDEYARILIRGTKVIVRRAQSQSIAAMKKVRFEESKKATLDLAEAFTSVPRGQAMREAGRHA
jgi:hypothetical protein